VLAEIFRPTLNNQISMESSEIEFTKEDVVYSKIGSALISAQRVEFITGKILELLNEYGDLYGIMTEDFTSNSEKSKKIRKKTLGHIFKDLKLNPTLVIIDELDEYARLRNILVHKFFETHLNTKSNEQMWVTISFCYAFGRFSNRMENFFKGFLYMLSLRHVKDMHHLSKEIQELRPSFEYFMTSLDHKKLQGIEGESIDIFDV
jgi:ABC-type dipeptide/oligopeptide/nickel transport system ATPase component